MHATISIYKRFTAVTFYTIRCEDKQSSADDFFTRMSQEKELINQVQIIAAWMKRVGNSYDGLTYDMLREEDKSFAIPPKRVRMKDGSRVELRLYCHWINERIVILFNGGKKTHNKALLCPNVRSYFLQAQSWSKQLNNSGIEHDGYEIINQSDILINC